MRSINVGLLGDSQVGKSMLVNRLCQMPDYDPTGRPEELQRRIQMDGETVTLILADAE